MEGERVDRRKGERSCYKGRGRRERNVESVRE